MTSASKRQRTLPVQLPVQTSTQLGDLPPEMLQHVMSFMDVPTRGAVASTSSQFRDVNALFARKDVLLRATKEANDFLKVGQRLQALGDKRRALDGKVQVLTSLQEGIQESILQQVVTLSRSFSEDSSQELAEALESLYDTKLPFEHFAQLPEATQDFVRTALMESNKVADDADSVFAFNNNPVAQPFMDWTPSSAQTAMDFMNAFFRTEADVEAFAGEDVNPLAQQPFGDAMQELQELPKVFSDAWRNNPEWFDEHKWQIVDEDEEASPDDWLYPYLNPRHLFVLSGSEDE